MDYLTTQRLLQAKQLLTDTDLPVTEVAFACGFESLRRFNAVFAEQVRLKPPSFGARARRRASCRAAAPRRPSRACAWDTARRTTSTAMLAFWGQRALAGVEQVEGRTLRRTWAAPPRPRTTPPRPPRQAAEPARGWIEIEFLPIAQRCRAAREREPRGCMAASCVEAARHALDLDADPAHMAPVLAMPLRGCPHSAPRRGCGCPAASTASRRRRASCSGSR
jgi:AraC family transcriptional regulator of adaptative response / DNA-3-methyladenine glycosylase II